MSDQVLSLFLIVTLGAALGRLTWRGFSLGTSAVLFVALIAGHLGYEVPRVAGVLGLVSFLYCLGISAGPSFFRVFGQQGSSLALVGAAMILAAAAGTWLFARLTHLPADLTAGMFAGALTSTPALAASLEVLPGDSQLAVGFGIAYAFGALGVVLFVQLAPRWLGGFSAEVAETETSRKSAEITRELVEVLNPTVVGKRLSQLPLLAKSNCQISRILVGDQMRPLPPDFTLQTGQQLLIIGTRLNVALVVDLLGQRSTRTDYHLDTERHRRRVVAASREIVGHSLEQLHLRSRFGVTITRITRHDLEFVPDAAQVIQFGDALTAVGESDSLERFVQFAGHRERSFDETDLISLSCGLFLGVLLGKVRFQLGENTISLGMAGGPLLVGLLMGHFGRIGPLVGHFPRASRMLLTEVGLAMFLADAGVQAGAELLNVIQTHGWSICAGSIVITAVPLVVGVLLTRRFLGVGALQALGCICGAMTSTPGLGALTSKVESHIPITSYATVYPLALIMMSILAPVLITLMQ